MASALCGRTALAVASKYVDDGAAMFGADAIARVTAIDDSLQRRTGKTVTVVTVKTTSGVAIQEAAAREAKARHLNGAIIYAARDDRQLAIAYGAKTSELFSPALQTSIKQALRAAFRAGDYDGGLVTAVSAIADVIEGGASGGHGPAPQSVSAVQQRWNSTGYDTSFIWWVLGGIAAILIVRGLILRRPPQRLFESGTVQPASAAPQTGAVQPGTQPAGSPPQSSGSGFIPSLLGGAAGGFIGSELASSGHQQPAPETTPAPEPAADSPSSGSDDGGGFTDSGGSGDFSGGDTGGADSGGSW
ncbi:MAG TPA: TPM domain-containing protein [Candidatus Eremiobacteraceae bacterium]|nr:TPM domain-containing protein [Candidatus Eremiobacteraceae bacterium]